MPSAVLTPFTSAEAVELGNRLWRKKVLPVGDVEYKGRLLHFTRDYLGRLVAAFQSRAYDQVPFQLAPGDNSHSNDPERTRGEITSMELGDDGLYVTAEVNEDGEKVLKDNPRLGVSARIVEDYARSDGRHFPAAIQHVLGTLDPRIPGLGAWEAIEAASPEPDRVLDLSGESFTDLTGPGGWSHGWIHTGTEGAAPEDKADRMSKNISGHSFGDGPDGAEALSAHKQAAAAHRQAAKLSSSPSAVAHHQKMAKLHSAVASGRMESYSASKQMDLAVPGAGGTVIDLDWAAWDAKHGINWGAVGKSHGKPPPDRGQDDEEKASNHIADAKKASSMGMHDAAAAHLARASALTKDPATQAKVSTVGKGAAQAAMQAGKGSAFQLANEPGTAQPERTTSMADLGNLTDTQRARLAKLLDLDDDVLDALAAGGTVITPEELDALTAPDDDDSDEDGLAAQVEAMTDEELDALEAEFNAELGDAAEDNDHVPEGEPVAAGMSAEAQFAIDLANAKVEETQRELAMITARLHEEDYQAEKRRLADMGVPPYITDLAKPLLEGAGRAVELSNGKTVDAGAIMRRVLSEYARQAKLLDLDVELGSPMDEPEDAGREQQVQSRGDLVNRFKSMTGL